MAEIKNGSLFAEAGSEASAQGLICVPELELSLSAFLV
jgi:hypothetical protein